MNRKIKTLKVTIGLIFLVLPLILNAQKQDLKEHILFYSSFDGTPSATIARGDSNIYTAENYKQAAHAQKGLSDPNVILAKGQGLIGDAIHFQDAKTAAIFYKAHKNVGYSGTSWSGTISFWLRLDSNKGLPPHYCDPICITDSKWSDAGLWVDFTDHNPRMFRMGAMGDIAIWDPNNDSDEADWNKRTIVVNPSPFQSKSWTHVAMVFSNVNGSQPTFELYLNGKSQGIINDVDDPFTWEPENGKIMLGLGYIGLMDELAIFDLPLSAAEVASIHTLENGIQTLLQ